MEIISPASSERADACTSRCIRLIGLQPDEAEKIGLLAAILGWEVEPPHAWGRVRCWVGGFPDAFGSSAGAAVGATAGQRWAGDDWAPGEWGPHHLPPHDLAGTKWAAVQDGSASGATLDGRWLRGEPAGGAGVQRHAPPRLELRQIDSVIRVRIEEAALADQCARLGLDRLVVPVSLLALEELLTFAG